MNIGKKIGIAVIIVLGIIVLGLVAFVYASEKLIATKPDTLQLNIDSWQSSNLEDAAQLKLAPEYANVVRRLIETRFTVNNPRIVELTGRRIWDIAGDRATPIVLEYVNDPRVVVAENAKWWYKNYCPKAIMNRIDAGKTAVSPGMPAPAVPPVLNNPAAALAPTPGPKAHIRPATQARSASQIERMEDINRRIEELKNNRKKTEGELTLIKIELRGREDTIYGVYSLSPRKGQLIRDLDLLDAKIRMLQEDLQKEQGS